MTKFQKFANKICQLGTLVGKGFCDWNHALEHLRNYEQSMEHIDATITFQM